MLIMPGELVQLPGGKIVKCCDGQLAEDLVKGEASLFSLNVQNSIFR